MKRNAKQSSRSSGSGSRLRLTLLLATAAALLLVPAAAASAANDTHISISGTGSGEVVGAGVEESEGGVPHLECSYASPGPQNGVCDTEAQESAFGFPGVGVEAKAAPGSAFAGWTIEETVVEGAFPLENCEEPGSNTCSVLLLEGEMTIKATFNKAFTVEKVGGEGTIVGAESGMECLPAESSCTVEYTGPETLTASPAEGYAFSKWKGCTKVPTEVLSCTVTATSATKVIAYFVPTNSVKVTKSGLGYGTVKTTGISCDESCPTAEAAIQSGKPVKITATPAKGSEAAVISGGSGEASGCTASGCEFTINANQELTVAFAPIPTHTVKVNLTGPGAFKGKVTGAGAGVVKGLLKSKISCGTGCTTATESFFATDTVTLTATPATGYKFEGWSGDCSGTGTCVLATPSSNKVVNAEFK